MRRDEGGVVLAAAIKQVKAKWDAPIAEAKALLFRLKLALNCGFYTVVAESDCLGVTSHLKKGVADLYSVFVVCKDIFNISSLFLLIGVMSKER